MNDGRPGIIPHFTLARVNQAQSGPRRRYLRVGSNNPTQAKTRLEWATHFLAVEQGLFVFFRAGLFAYKGRTAGFPDGCEFHELHPGMIRIEEI
jgi:hypothetical protein